ncbi:MAG: DUF2914 domain-containing protein [Candidatus Pacebacteria bacterium]|nr:DUF2914 domain-containing protein [Candidatus Paceibacterota bacterium]
MIKQILKLFEKYSRYLSSFGLIFGLIITPLTLTRVDNLTNNLWIIIQLLIAVFGIIFLHFLDNKVKEGKIKKEYSNDIDFWFTLIIQFAFGNLFSTYVVLYFRSSTLFLSWPFVLLILILLIGNEIWVKHYSKLTLQLTTFFLAIYMFLIFSLPILIGRIGDDIFLLSGVISLILIFLLIKILSVFVKENFIKSKRALTFSLLGTFIIMNGMYFLNIIPPIPLSLKDAGVYHSVQRINNEYVLKGETKTWRDYFRVYEIYHKKVGESVHVFTSVFSPTKFDTKIIHEWQYYDEVQKEWVTSNKITLSIVGGRDDGYRTYSEKSNISLGKWRVNILTLKGRVIGRVNFRVE